MSNRKGQQPRKSVGNVKSSSSGSDLLGKRNVPMVPLHIQKRIQKRRALIASVMESYKFSFVMIVFSLWSLFSDDIRISSTTKAADVGFDAVISIIFFSFLFEIGVNCYYKDDYFIWPNWNSEIVKETLWRTWLRRLQLGSFYFWLDLIASGSLLLEMDWIVSDSYADMYSSGYQISGYSLRAGSFVCSRWPNLNVP